jgi:hypothetical protein
LTDDYRSQVYRAFLAAAGGSAGAARATDAAAKTDRTAASRNMERPTSTGL